jgi:hypothetical protein
MTNTDDGIDDYFNNHWLNNQSINPQDRVSMHIQNIAKVKQEEQERIIQLLEDNLGNMDLDDLLKLIKEETK